MARPPQQRILLGGEVHLAEWLNHSEGGQRLLAEHHDSLRRPRCQCVPGGVDMGIAKRGSRYHLARLPGSGFLHDSDCHSVESVNPLSGSSSYSRHAMLQNGDGEMHVVFSPSVERGRHNIPAVSLDGLLDLLIDGAGLNTLREPVELQRVWRDVRDSLAHAAVETHLAGYGPLTSQILLPPPFDKDAYAGIQAQQEAFLSAPDGLRFVCAPLREIKATSFGWLVGLKHLPRSNFWLSREAGARFAAAAGGTDPLSNPPVPGLALALVKAGRQDHNFTITHLAVRRVDMRFMPCQSEAEALAADELAARSVPFMRPLRFDASWDYPLADYVLFFGDSQRMAYVLSDTGCEEVDASKRVTVSVLASNGVIASIWDNGRWAHAPESISKPSG